MSKQTDLDRLAQLSESDLHAVVEVVEQAIMLGDGWLQRQSGGALKALDSARVTIAEHPHDSGETRGGVDG